MWRTCTMADSSPSWFSDQSLLYSLREAMVCALLLLFHISSYEALITFYGWSSLPISSLSLWDSGGRRYWKRRGKNTDMSLMNQHNSPSHKKAGAAARNSVNTHTMDVPACRDVPYALARLLIPRSIKVPSVSFIFEQWRRSGCSS